MTQKFEMPKMSKEDVRKAIESHAHLLKRYCPKSKGIGWRDEIFGLYLEIIPYVIATFYPERGEMIITLNEKQFDVIFNRFFKCYLKATKKEAGAGE